MLLLPLPLGPTISVIPAGKLIFVFLAKDLNPINSTDFNFKDSAS
ncbi:MAG: Hypothetical protein AJITA_01015 [Acetilactobacillus jinshanensis]